MGEEYDGAAGAGGVEQVLLQGRRQSSGKVWGIERYVAQISCEKHTEADITRCRTVFQGAEGGKSTRVPV